MLLSLLRVERDGKERRLGPAFWNANQVSDMQVETPVPSRAETKEGMPYLRACSFFKKYTLLGNQN